MIKSRLLRLVIVAFGLNVNSSFCVLANDQDDYINMDLEQLIKVNVYATSVLSAHIHQQDEIMLGYNIVNMKMNQLLDGTTKVSTTDLLGPEYGYMVTPVAMSTTLQSFHLMYAPSDELTWIIKLKYLEKQMHHQSKSGTFSTKSSGWGDSQVKANYILSHDMAAGIEHQYAVTVGLSLPTGSITRQDMIPSNTDSLSQLPYSMQLGSGTYDPILGMSYHAMTQSWYWGAQLIQVSRIMGNNSQGYRLGNQTKLNSWLHYSWNDNLAFYGQLNFKYQQAIKGQDKDIPTMMQAVNPMADPRLSRQNKINIVAGINYAVTHGPLKGHRFSAEFNMPIYQDLIGPQLSQHRNIRFGWQLLF